MIRFALFLFFVLGLSGQPKPTPSPWDGRAKLTLSEVIATHPEALVRVDLFNWIQSGKVILSPLRVGSMFASVEQSPKGPKVCLWFDAVGILQPIYLDSVNQLELLRLSLYRETVRIENNFSGKFALDSVSSNKGESSKQKAERLWRGEQIFLTAEWEYVKKYNLRHLMPTMNEAVGEVETPRSFLRGFCSVLLNQTRDNGKLNKEINEICLREDKQISPMYK